MKMKFEEIKKKVSEIKIREESLTNLNDCLNECASDPLSFHEEVTLHKYQIALLIKIEKEEVEKIKNLLEGTNDD